jgi:hypothetical protein
VKTAPTLFAWAFLGAASSAAQEAECRLVCAPEFKVEPTWTFTNMFGAPRIVAEDGSTTREAQEVEFELILSVGLPTRAEWLEFTVEAIFLPFDADAAPELEFEANFTWLAPQCTAGWVSSHFDVVDKYSPAERPEDERAYTHKLNLELDTSVAIFNWLPGWLRNVELEASLDYVATGLSEASDRIDGALYLDAASPWSLSIVLGLPIGSF